MKSHPIIAFLFIWTLHHRPLSLASAQGGIVGGSDVNPSTICGDDNRVPSFDLRQGRLVTPGLGTCTAWLISEDVFLTAGHCGVPDEEWRVHFTFGADDAPEEDQYAIETELDVNPASYGATFIPRLGLDWAAGRLKPNDITGKLPGVAQSEKCGTMGCGWYSLGPVPSQASGNSITITGYGSNVDNSVPQKTSTGALVGITQVKLFYATDSMVRKVQLVFISCLHLFQYFLLHIMLQRTTHIDVHCGSESLTLGWKLWWSHPTFPNGQSNWNPHKRWVWSYRWS